MKKFLSFLVPMVLVERRRFVDAVTGVDVNIYKERFTGRVVMAEGAFRWFRVPLRSEDKGGI